MAKNTIHIDLDKILETAKKGVRRTTVFMGLGMNAAVDPAMTNYSLQGHSAVQLAPEGYPAETIAHFKSEFGKWIVGCGLRELLENFESFMLELFDACMFSAIHADKITREAAEKKRKDFSFGGLSIKLDIFERMGIKGCHTQHFPSLYALRNCLTHRQGKVGQEDCKDPSFPDRLVVGWRGFVLEIQEPNGNIIPLASEKNVPEGLPILLPDGGNIILRTLERRYEYPKGTVVELTPGQVAEICVFVGTAAESLVSAVVDFVEGQCGLPVHRIAKENHPDSGH